MYNNQTDTNELITDQLGYNANRYGISEIALSGNGKQLVILVKSSGLFLNKYGIKQITIH
jgi:hypothetical protein